MPKALSIAEQIRHINQHIDKFHALLMSSTRTVESYFKEYHNEYKSEGDSIYRCLCTDMGIKPLDGEPE